LGCVWSSAVEVIAKEKVETRWNGKGERAHVPANPLFFACHALGKVLKIDAGNLGISNKSS